MEHGAPSGPRGGQRLHVGRGGVMGLNSASPSWSISEWVGGRYRRVIPNPLLGEGVRYLYRVRLREIQIIVVSFLSLSLALFSLNERRLAEGREVLAKAGNHRSQCIDAKSLFAHLGQVFVIPGWGEGCLMGNFTPQKYAGKAEKG